MGCFSISNKEDCVSSKVKGASKKPIPSIGKSDVKKNDSGSIFGILFNGSTD